eukprot:Gb_27777 [translate_table: standard]
MGSSHTAVHMIGGTSAIACERFTPCPGRHVDSVSSSHVETFSKLQLLPTRRDFNKFVCRFRRTALQYPEKASFQMQKTMRMLAGSGDHLGTSSVHISMDSVSKPGISMNRHFPFYVMLPVDTLSSSNTLNHVKAIQAGLQALKVLGIDGVLMQVWWGIVEGDAPTKYDWSAYLALVKMIQEAGLKVQASMCFHGCKYGGKKTFIPLPSWVLKVGDSDPNIFYTDRAGNRYRDCLSLAVDSLPLFEGRSPLQMFSEVFRSFRKTFAPYIGNTIVEISVGLGPSGELRYPSSPEGMWKFPGVGEFQCYDKYMLANLKQHSVALGHSVWGLGGPHDALSYNQWPNEGGFFNDNGGSWNSPYGEFFLSWYTSQLIAHGDRMLSLAARIFREDEVIVAGKLPAIPWWYKTKSHAAELTAGFYNVEGRDGYDAVAKMFAKNASLLILPRMDVSDMDHPAEARCSPESLFLQIRRACYKYGVPVAGENTFPRFESAAFKSITKNIYLRDSPDLPCLTSFTFSSMGESLFFPDHWHLFCNFFRNLDQSALVDNESDMPPKCQDAVSCSFSNKEQLVQI